MSSCSGPACSSVVIGTMMSQAGARTLTDSRGVTRDPLPEPVLLMAGWLENSFTDAGLGIELRERLGSTWISNPRYEND